MAIRNERGAASSATQAQPAKPTLPWGVQIAGNFSQQQAMAAFQRTRQRFAGILPNADPVVVRRRGPARAALHTVRIATETRQGAEQLCSKLRAAGGACLVLRN